MKYQNILDLIGNTPLVKLNKINNNKNVEIWIKLEGFNPSGSIKDRVAVNIVKKAVAEGKLTKEKTIVEVSSGNTGISLSMIGSLMDYKVIVVMPANVSIERQKLITLLGAQIILTDSKFGELGARRKAIEIYETNKKNYWLSDQFSNGNNYKAQESTANEILKDLPEVTHVFSAMGTSGTFTGLERTLVKKGVEIVGIQPKNGEIIDGLVNFADEEIPPIFNASKKNSIRYVSREAAILTARKLISYEGIFSGISTGASLYAALNFSKKIKKGKIVVISADRVERYFSTDLFK